MLPPAPRLGPLIALLALLTPARGQGGSGPSPNYTRPVFLCGGDVSGESGYVASEGFPNHYPPSKECVWTITVPDGQVVALSFRVFDLELDSTCRYDALEIFAGPGTEGRRLGTFCGTFRPGPVVAPGNRVTLRMRADEGTGGRGFLIWYHGRAAHGNEHQVCGGRLEKPQGTLTTPNWPESDYPPGVSCSWLIRAPQDQVISLTFGKFDLEPDNYCRYDYVAVFNGAQSNDARRLGKFCGDTAPGSISSDDNELLVQFVSDLSVTADGFTASYTTRPRGSGEGAGGSRTPASPDFPTPPAHPKVKPKVKLPPKPKVPPPEKPKAGAAQIPEIPESPGASSQCPKQCRRTGTLQGNFCASDFVVTGTVQSVTRGAGQGLSVSVGIIGAYKSLGLTLPPDPAGTVLTITVPCRNCPPLKKGASYLLMGRVDESGVAILPPDSFVVPQRPPQHQILTNLAQRECPSGAKA
ncbi:procollagen C-endopeptidase enhancer 1 [Tachyglossus aculeatus]|uniref:procollagen C-endopeptidase enhancer 1 n=1 Tax=Tachyglossus aculeatus TaxID=9261 RepID=UPI0018F29678|nr:procollagen C-endopeptidase enhancer 1 [Tachyglossus aculeatus]